VKKIFIFILIFLHFHSVKDPHFCQVLILCGDQDWESLECPPVRVH